MKKNKNKLLGFTLVEILASITILGILMCIGYAGVSSIITKSKEAEFEQQKKNIIMAAKSYLKNNTAKTPKNIGDHVNISLQELLETNYLEKEVTNTKKESCMENSYVRVYKYSKAEYTYTPYLYCGDDEVPVEEEAPRPVIKIKLTDSTDNEDKKVFNNVSSATMNIKITGGDINGTNIAIDGYLFSISTKSSATDDYVEIYNSGTLSANNKDTIKIKKKITDYVSLTGSTYISVKVVATNKSGGSNEVTVSATSDGSGIYNDEVKPVCSTITGQAKDETDWVNKAAVATKKYRTISVDCLDGDGSGCLRPTFTVSWPSNSEPNKEYSYIKIKDNNGNYDKCRVRVNVDQVAPTLELKAYTAINSELDYNNTNVITSTAIASDTKSPVTISSSYTNVQGGSWLNNTYYPYGIVYTVDATDNLHLYRWTWETNEAYINDANNSKYKVTSSKNPEATSGYFKTRDLTIYDNGTEEEQITFNFLTEGKRYGKLTVYDRAGNYTVFYIKADIDRTAPPVPTTDYTYTESGKTYSEKTWTNKSITATVQTSYKRDNLSNSGKSTVSGWNRFEYEIRYHGVSETTKASLSGSANSYNLKANSTFEGRDKVRWRSCDKANNCSAYNDNFNVYIDVTAPKCNLQEKTNSGSNYSGSWLGIGQKVTLTSTCEDPNSSSNNKGSGCVDTTSYPRTFSYTYSSDINTDSAGAKGVNSPGKVKDVAGNVTTCKTATVKIDHKSPTCNVTVTKANGTAYDESSWLNRSNYAIVKASCTDPSVTSSYTNSSVSSGCKTADFSFSYKGDYDITNAGAAGVGKGGTVTDNAGNSTDCLANKKVKVDYTNPTLSCKMNGNKIEVSNTDDKGGSGYKETKYSFNNGSSWGTSNSVTLSCGQSATGYALAIDNAGNTSSVKCGTYKTKECCSNDGEEHSGCQVLYACRIGNTFVYTGTDARTFWGTVSHTDKMYKLGEEGSFYKVYVESGDQYVKNTKVGYIKYYCTTSDPNTVCTRQTCNEHNG
jgi:prepilin-type N-terminal cleavage/methylation domain-containing protein